MSGAEVVGTQINVTFQQAVGTAQIQPSPESKCSKKPKKRRDAPFSLRLSVDERAYLEELAGDHPLGAYIRSVLLGDKADKRRRLRKPSIDDKQAAVLLAELGKSRMSSNLNQLAHHANMGTLDVSEDVEQQLQDAYAAVLAMREALFIALGLKCGGNK